MASCGDDVPHLHLSPSTEEPNTDAESAGSHRRKGKKKKKRKSRESSPVPQASADSQVTLLMALVEESKRQAAKATEALKRLQDATAEAESASRVPDKEPAAEPMQVDQPVAKPSTPQSKAKVVKGKDEAAKPSVDSTKAVPSKVPKPKPKDSGKGTRVKASASTRPPPTAIEPATVEHGAVEEQVPEGPTGAIAAEAWETVTRRVKGRRQKPDTRPPPRSLEDFRHGKVIRLPPLVNVGGESDEEEWFEDESHPIDWYVALINSIVTSSPNAGIALEERTRLKFAWDTFMPGGRCIFTSCQAPRETPRKFSCDGRYARHLVEYHRRIRPVFGCNDRKGQY